MEDKWRFSFRHHIPIKGMALTADEEEKRLLARLNDPGGDQQAARLELVRFYRSASRVVDAMYHAEAYLANTADLEKKAEAYFHLGQAMEHVKDWESACRFYTKALEFEPTSVFYWYFIHNNIGFSLNQLGRHVDAEKYLREAVVIDPSRANGFKNLGLSLEGQGRLIEAAQNFIDSVKADASDPRALTHLQELTARHPGLFRTMPQLQDHIRRCRSAVRAVQRMNHEQNLPSRN